VSSIITAIRRIDDTQVKRSCRQACTKKDGKSRLRIAGRVPRTLRAGRSAWEALPTLIYHYVLSRFSNEILISGYYGFGNAGDELILETIASELRLKREDLELTVLSVSPEKTLKTHKLRAVSRWNVRKVIAEIVRCDVLISGGGGLFQDSTGSTGLYYYLAIILLAKILRKKVFIYGAGVNELRNLNRIITSGIFKLADGITVRESDSAHLLVKWGASERKNNRHRRPGDAQRSKA